MLHLLHILHTSQYYNVILYGEQSFATFYIELRISRTKISNLSDSWYEWKHLIRVRMTTWWVDDDLPYLCSLVRHSVSQNIVLILYIRRTTWGFSLVCFNVDKFKNNSRDWFSWKTISITICFKTRGVFERMLYLYMFEKMLHGMLLTQKYVLHILVDSEFDELVEWFIIKLYAT